MGALWYTKTVTRSDAHKLKGGISVEIDPTKIGKKLRQLRGTRTQAEIANAVNVGVTSITNYEAGIRTPRDEIKLRLAKYFGVSVESIFFDPYVTISDNSPSKEEATQ